MNQLMRESLWSRFELRQLRCFVAAAEDLHFSRAAARLNMTQPPFSRQIQLLERVLGAKLFNRTSRSVELTLEGQNFLSEARRIVRLSENAARSIHQIASGKAGILSLGFTASCGYSFLPRLLVEQAMHSPDTDVILNEMVGTEQIRNLISDSLDLGLMRLPVMNREFTSVKVADEGLVAALPFGDPRLTKDSLHLSDFDHQPLIMFAQKGARHFHDLLARLFAQEGVTPIAIQLMSQMHSMLALVQVGMGAAIVPEAAQSLHFNGVKFRPIITTPAKPVELFAVWKVNNKNPALKSFLNLLEPYRPSIPAQPRRKTITMA